MPTSLAAWPHVHIFCMYVSGSLNGLRTGLSDLRTACDHDIAVGNGSGMDNYGSLSGTRPPRRSTASWRPAIAGRKRELKSNFSLVRKLLACMHAQSPGIVCPMAIAGEHGKRTPFRMLQNRSEIGSKHRSPEKDCDGNALAIAALRRRCDLVTRKK